MEHYLAIIRSEVLTYATTQMNAENIMLSGRKPNTKGHVSYMPFI